MDLDLGMRGGEGGEEVRKEAAGLGVCVSARSTLSRQNLGDWGGKGDLLHAFGTSGPVAVVKFQAFALQDECADAILGVVRWGCEGEGWRLTRPTEVRRMALNGMLAMDLERTSWVLIMGSVGVVR